MNTKFQFTTYLFIFLFCLHSKAGIGLVGPEFTLTRSDLFQLGRSGNATDQYYTNIFRELEMAIRRNCTDCTILIDDTSKPVMTVTVPGGFTIKYARDPWVIEVTTSPLHPSQIQNQIFIEKTQKIIWNAAREIGFEPHSRVGGGHIHFDLESHFEGNVLHFFNFVVDIANHPELFLGALGFDLLNAPPIAVLSEKQRNAFKDIVQNFDPQTQTIDDLKSIIRNRVYSKSFLMNKYDHVDYYTTKYQALNLDHQKTLELRGFRPQESIQHFVLDIQLIQSRIEKLKNLKQPLQYIEKDYSELVKVRTEDNLQVYTSQISSSQIVNSYRSYVEGAGLAWEIYNQHITEFLRQKIEQDNIFAPIACENILSAS